MKIRKRMAFDVVTEYIEVYVQGCTNAKNSLKMGR